MYYRCCVPGCNSLRQDVQLHKFPVDKVRLQLWLKNIKSEVLGSLNLVEIANKYQVCHNHFESRFITSKFNLRITAVPTLFSDVEISSGVPNVAESTSDILEHSPAKCIHFDHTYAKIVVTLTQHGDEFPDPRPSTSKLTTFDVTLPSLPPADLGPSTSKFDEETLPILPSPEPIPSTSKIVSPEEPRPLLIASPPGTHSDGRPVSTTLRNTAEVISFLDSLFDSVNGSALTGSPGKDLRKAVTSSTNHHKFWMESKEKLKGLKFLDTNNTQKSVPSIINWIQTITSFQSLWQFFCENNYPIMRPRYFNSDAIENFFGQVRAYSYRSNNPTCHNFESTFKSLLMTGFIKWHHNSFNCEKDFAKQLINIKSLFSEFKDQNDCNNQIQTQNHCVSEEVLGTSSLEAARKERLNIQSRAYTTGWVIRKILKNNKCSVCKNALTVEQNENIHNWIDCREYNKNRRKLIYPSEQAIVNFGKILKETNKCLELYSSEPNISKIIFKSIINKCNFHIQCIDHKEYVIKAFIKITIKLGIHNWCNIINRILKGTDIERLKSKLNISVMQQKALEKFNKSRRKVKK